MSDFLDNLSEAAITCLRDLQSGEVETLSVPGVQVLVLVRIIHSAAGLSAVLVRDLTWLCNFTCRAQAIGCCLRADVSHHPAKPGISLSWLVFLSPITWLRNNTQATNKVGWAECSRFVFPDRVLPVADVSPRARSEGFFVKSMNMCRLLVISRQRSQVNACNFWRRSW